MVDVRDAAEAFVQAMLVGKAGQTYLLGSLNCATRDLFSMLESLTGVRKPSFSAPAWVARNGAWALDLLNRRIRNKYDPGVDPVRGEMSCHWWGISSAAARRDLGFQPRPPRQTILDTVAYIRALQPGVAKIQSKL